MSDPDPWVELCQIYNIDPAELNALAKIEALQLQDDHVLNQMDKSNGS